MKVKPEQSGRTRRQIREVERKLSIFLDTPAEPQRSGGEQFGVYDEDEKFAGDIVADGQFFTEEELETKIKRLLR